MTALLIIAAALAYITIGAIVGWFHGRREWRKSGMVARQDAWIMFWSSVALWPSTVWWLFDWDRIGERLFGGNR